MDNFDLRKYLVENKVTTNSRMVEENWVPAVKPKTVRKVEFPNGKTFEKGGEDMEGNIVIFIHKYPDGYGVSGQEYSWEDGEYGKEAYTYYFDNEGNEAEEGDIVKYVKK